MQYNTGWAGARLRRVQDSTSDDVRCLKAPLKPRNALK